MGTKEAASGSRGRKQARSDVENFRCITVQRDRICSGTKAAAGAGIRNIVGCSAIGDVVKTTVQRMREEASGTRDQGTIEGREAGSRHDVPSRR